MGEGAPRTKDGGPLHRSAQENFSSRPLPSPPQLAAPTPYITVLLKTRQQNLQKKKLLIIKVIWRFRDS